MVIFVAYEGFELIANSISDLKNKEKDTEKAYFGAVVFVVVLYILIAIVTVGSLPFSEIANAKDYVLAKASEPVLGQIRFYGYNHYRLNFNIFRNKCYCTWQ